MHTEYFVCTPYKQKEVSKPYVSRKWAIKKLIEMRTLRPYMGYKLVGYFVKDGSVHQFQEDHL